MKRTSKVAFRKMPIYLNLGGGVSSTGMLLKAIEEKWEFEALYVDHESDWPETRIFVKETLSQVHPITILKPQHKVKGRMVSSLYEYCWEYKIIPRRRPRWCTEKFKITPINKYIEKPCFTCIGFELNEIHRATLDERKGEVLRYPLIEWEMTRADCINLIKKSGLPMPIKSSCYFCPFQGIEQWRRLRRERPDLFCKVEMLEKRQIQDRIKRGKYPVYLKRDVPITQFNEPAGLLEEFDQPPCYCHD